MRRLATLAAALVLFASPALAQGTISGTFTLDRQASDNVDQAIAKAVKDMNFVTRPIARGRLQKTNQPYQTVTIANAGANTVVTIDKLPARSAPSNGTPVDWTRADGEKFKLSMTWANGQLTESFRAEDGQRENTYMLSPDGATLTMNVKVSSPRLPKPLTYKLLFKKS